MTDWRERLRPGRRWNLWLAWQVLRGRIVSIDVSVDYSGQRITIGLIGGRR